MYWPHSLTNVSSTSRIAGNLNIYINIGLGVYATKNRKLSNLIIYISIFKKIRKICYILYRLISCLIPEFSVCQVKM